MISDVYGQQMEYSGLKHHVIWQGFTNFSDEYNTPIWKLYYEDEGSMSLRNFGNNLLDTALHPRRRNLHSHRRESLPVGEMFR